MRTSSNLESVFRLPPIGLAILSLLLLHIIPVFTQSCGSRKGFAASVAPQISSPANHLRCVRTSRARRGASHILALIVGKFSTRAARSRSLLTLRPSRRSAELLPEITGLQDTRRTQSTTFRACASFLPDENSWGSPANRCSTASRLALTFR